MCLKMAKCAIFSPFWVFHLKLYQNSADSTAKFYHWIIIYGNFPHPLGISGCAENSQPPRNLIFGLFAFCIFARLFFDSTQALTYIILLYLCLDLLDNYCHFGDSDTDLRGENDFIVKRLKKTFAHPFLVFLGP